MSQTLLLPGLICGSEIWEHQVKNIAGAVAIDGYGLRDNFQDMASFVLASVEGDFNLVGHSMGGRVALEVYRKAPKRVLNLVLFDTGVHPLKVGEPDKRHALVKLGEEKGIDALIDTWLPPMVAPVNRNEALMRPLKDMCKRKGLDTFKAHVNALLNRPSLEGFLEQISVPTLVGTGTLDSWSPPDQHRKISSRIPQSHLVFFEGAGHMAPIEKPKAVSEALSSFLNEAVSRNPTYL